jgi:hypothetical protein
MGSLANDLQRVVTDSFAGSLDRTMQTERRFQHQYGFGSAGHAFCNRTRGIAADLFIGNQQHREWPGQRVTVPRPESLDRVQHKCNSGFHVQCAWSPQPAIVDAARHRLQCAKRINGVVVSQQQHRFATAFAGKVDLQVIAEIVGAMKHGVAAKSLKTASQQRGEPVRRRLVVAGGFDLHQLADSLDYAFTPLLEIAQPLGKVIVDGGSRSFWLALRWSFWFSFQSCFRFLAGFPGHAILCRRPGLPLSALQGSGTV